jgi:hypothetical protein
MSLSARQQRLMVVATLVAMITGAHVLLAGWVAQQAHRPATEVGMDRLQASYQAELRFSAPPVAASPPPPPPSPSPRAPVAVPPPAAGDAAAVMPAASAASAVDEAPTDTEPDAPESVASAASVPEDTLDEATALASASTTEDVALGVVPPTAEAETDTGETFEWPLATRVSYKLEGHFRGPVHGQATVEWLRKDRRYQVHIDASVGPSFAPIGSWRLSSEGVIKAAGLVPARHEHEDRLFIRGTRLRHSDFSADTVRLYDGQELPRPTAMQDPASLLIQIAYQFIIMPERAQPGTIMELPVVTTRRVELMRFEVEGLEEINTAVGPIEAVRVKPQRLLKDKGSAPAEMWFAPSLQYLPVKIMVRSATETSHMQLTLASMPQQMTAPPASPRREESLLPP